MDIAVKLLEKASYDLFQDYHLNRLQIFRQNDDTPDLFLKIDSESHPLRAIVYTGVPQAGWGILQETRPYTHFKILLLTAQELQKTSPELKKKKFHPFLIIMSINLGLEKWFLILERSSEFTRIELEKLINYKDDFHSLIELSSFQQEIERKRKQNDFLFQILEESFHSRFEGFLENLLIRLRSFFNLEGIAFLEDSPSGFEVKSHQNLPQERLNLLSSHLSEYILNFINPEIPELNEGGSPGFSPAPSKTFFFEYQGKSVYFCPLVHGKESLGTLIMTKTGPQSLISEQDLKILSSISQEMALAFKKNELEKHLEEKRSQLEEKSKRNEVFYSLTKALNNTLNPEKVVLELFDHIPLILDCDYFGILADTEETGTPTLFFSHCFSRTHSIEKSCGTKIREIFSEYPHSLQTQKILEKFVPTGMKFRGDELEKNLADSLSLPLVLQGQIIGMFFLGSSTPGLFSREVFQNFSTVVNIFISALNNALWFRKTEKLAYTDLLTGLFNHRFFQEKLEEEFKRSTRYGHPLSLIFIDVDHFKNFNDTYGHQAGDVVLKQVGKLLKDCARKNIDIPARYGGEEFCIILPETDLDGAGLFADRLRQKIEKLSIQTSPGQKLSVTASFGVSSYIEGLFRDRHHFIEEADKALYKSKELGRNRVSLMDITKISPQKLSTGLTIGVNKKGNPSGKPQKIRKK